MNRTTLNYILVFIIALFVQTLVFDRIYISEYINVFFYLIFLLYLPVDTNKFLVIIYAFVLGFLVDIFNSTLGINAAAAVLVGFLRTYILKLYAPRDGYDITKLPIPKNYGWAWAIKYIATMIIIHHTFIYFIEIFSFDNFFNTLLKVICSSIISFVFIILGQLFLIKD